MPLIVPFSRTLWWARAALVGVTLLTLAGCDIPGLGPDPRIVQRDAEAQAIGGACRHAMRGLEDCYTLNPKAPKAQIYAGWKQMDQYMRENKVEGVPSVLTLAPRPTADAAPQGSAPPARAGDRG
ncbi:MAG: hypothetical protein OZ923_05055 [Comamonadaceae bacterium]|nr:hypothetical protein [Burkholderiales bacterium]MEB2347960.1 hypothetical protein [Comamonadaceae bacterium]